MPTCVSSVSIPIGSIYYHRVLNSIAPPPHAGLSMNAWEPIESWSSPVGPKLRLSWFGNLEIRESTGSNYSFPPDPHWFLSRHFPFLALFPSLLTLSLCTLSLSSRSFSPFFHKTLFRFSGSSSNRTSPSFFFFIYSFVYFIMQLFWLTAALDIGCVAAPVNVPNVPAMMNKDNVWINYALLVLQSSFTDYVLFSRFLTLVKW